MYDKLDKINEQIEDLDEELEKLNDQANIFEQTMPDFKQIRVIKKEVKLLKNLWDYVYVVTSSLDDWKTTVWKKLDIEGMDQECKKFIRELRRK